MGSFFLIDKAPTGIRKVRFLKSFACVLFNLYCNFRRHFPVQPQNKKTFKQLRNQISFVSSLLLSLHCTYLDADNEA